MSPLRPRLPWPPFFVGARRDGKSSPWRRTSRHSLSARRCSAFFAAVTALLGKAGVSEINSNLATLIRTVVILAVTIGIVSFRHEWEPLGQTSPLNFTPGSRAIRPALRYIASGHLGLAWIEDDRIPATTQRFDVVAMEWVKGSSDGAG